MVKYVHNANQTNNDQIPIWVNYALIYLRNAVNKKIITKNKLFDKVTDVIEKVLDFKKQQKSKRLKILTPEQMRQILRKLFAQEKAGNIFGNLLHEIHQTIYFLF